MRSALAELMSRMGHSSPRAARVYLRAREKRDAQLATALDKLARRELRRSADLASRNRSGMQRARKRRDSGSSSAMDHGQDGG